VSDVDEVRDGVAPSTGHEGAGATGDPQVDAVLAGLAGLAAQPLSTHVAAFEAVHTGLQARLADTEG